MLDFDTVYWISRPPVAWHVDTSAERTVSSLVLAVGAVLPLLAQRGLGRRRGG
jgi:hypothetical protein